MHDGRASRLMAACTDGTRNPTGTGLYPNRIITISGTIINYQYTYCTTGIAAVTLDAATSSLYFVCVVVTQQSQSEAYELRVMLNGAINSTLLLTGIASKPMVSFTNGTLWVGLTDPDAPDVKLSRWDAVNALLVPAVSYQTCPCGVAEVISVGGRLFLLCMTQSVECTLPSPAAIIVSVPLSNTGAPATVVWTADECQTPALQVDNIRLRIYATCGSNYFLSYDLHTNTSAQVVLDMEVISGYDSYNGFIIDETRNTLYLRGDTSFIDTAQESAILVYDIASGNTSVSPPICPGFSSITSLAIDAMTEVIYATCADSLGTLSQYRITAYSSTFRCQSGSTFNDRICQACPRITARGDISPEAAFMQTPQCLPCASGSIGPLPGAASCTPCIAGTFADAARDQICSSCSANTFTNQSSQTQCTTCPIGLVTLTCNHAQQ